MSTSNTHQQSLADFGSETRLPMLERGSYIPWASRFKRYLNRKRENRKWLNKAIDEGLYEFKEFTPSKTKPPRMKTEKDLTGDDLKYYEAEIEAINLILISIPNDIYNSVDACTIAQTMWQRVEREVLVSVYNRFAQLMNDMERNGIIFPKVTINTKFLNCLQPEWLKYFTQVRLTKRLTEDSYDDLFDYLSQYEKLINASRAKKLEKSHDPLALVEHTGSSSRTSSSYYVTHPSSVVDYDDEYQGDAFQNNSEYPLTSAMMLLARAITQRFSNPTNNHLRTSSNTRNQASVQADRINIQSRDSGNNGRNTRSSFVPEEIIMGNNVQNDAGNTNRTVQTTSSGSAANVQCYDYSEKGHYTRNCIKPRVQESKYFMEQMLLAKQDEAGGQAMQLHSSVSNIIFDESNVDVNSGSVEYDNNIQESYELEQLARNVYKEVEKQQIIAKKVQQQNTVLTKQLEPYKEKVRVFEITKGNNTTYFNEYIKADRKARRFEKELQSQFIRDRDIIQDLEQQRDKLQLSIVELKRQIVELQKTQTILKRKMSENEDKYHDTVLDLEARAKKNEDVVLKIGLIAASSVRGPSNRDSSFKNSALSNTKKFSEKVEVFNRTNKKTDVASTNVTLNKRISIRALVSRCGCLHVLLARSAGGCRGLGQLLWRWQGGSRLSDRGGWVWRWIGRGLIAASSVRGPSNRDLSFKNSALSNTKKFSEKVEVFNRTNNKTDVASTNVTLNKRIVIQIIIWIVDSGCSKHMTGDHTLLENFVEKFMSTENSVTLIQKLRSVQKHDMAASSPVCLISKATLTKSWPMRVASINGKKYILVIVDDYSRFTWVYFLHIKDETPMIIQKFIAHIQLNYNAKVHKIRTDNGTGFKDATLKAHYEKLGIMQQFSIDRTP
ncbi:retrovirus-related pol polyprotein from transposon TNT 1-94 [Tanacetum coccineum]